MTVYSTGILVWIYSLAGSSGYFGLLRVSIISRFSWSLMSLGTWIVFEREFYFKVDWAFRVW
jgi:hypothetical protein